MLLEGQSELRGWAGKGLVAGIAPIAGGAEATGAGVGGGEESLSFG